MTNTSAGFKRMIICDDYQDGEIIEEDNFLDEKIVGRLAANVSYPVYFNSYNCEINL